jgi:hypothetical protein
MSTFPNDNSSFLYVMNPLHSSTYALFERFPRDLGRVAFFAHPWKFSVANGRQRQLRSFLRGQQQFERLGIDRFRQVVIESRSSGTLLVLLLTPTGQGDKADACCPGLSPQRPGDAITIKFRHPYVEQRDVRTKRLCN